MNVVMELLNSRSVRLIVLCAVIISFFNGSLAQYPVMNNGKGTCCVPCALLKQMIQSYYALGIGRQGRIQPGTLNVQPGPFQQLQNDDEEDDGGDVWTNPGNVPDYSNQYDYQGQPQATEYQEFDSNNQMATFSNMVPAYMQPQYQNNYIPEQSYGEYQRNDWENTGNLPNSPFLEYDYPGQYYHPHTLDNPDFDYSYQENFAKTENVPAYPMGYDYQPATLNSEELEYNNQFVPFSNSVPTNMDQEHDYQPRTLNSEELDYSNQFMPLYDGAPEFMQAQLQDIDIPEQEYDQHQENYNPYDTTQDIDPLAQFRTSKMDTEKDRLTKHKKPVVAPSLKKTGKPHNPAPSSKKTATSKSTINDLDSGVTTMSADYYKKRRTPLDRLVKQIFQGTPDWPISKQSDVKSMSKNAQKLLKYLNVYAPRMYAMSHLPTIPKSYLRTIPNWFPFVNGRFDASIKDSGGPTPNAGARFKPTGIEEIPEPYRKAVRGANLLKDKSVNLKIDESDKKKGNKSSKTAKSEGSDDDAIEIVIDSAEAKEVKEAIAYLGKLNLTRKTKIKTLSMNALKLLKFLQVTLPKMYAETDLPVLPPKALKNVPEWYPGLAPLNITDDKKYSESVEDKKHADSKPAVMSGSEIPKKTEGGVKNLQGHVFGTSAVAPASALSKSGIPQPRSHVGNGQSKVNPFAINIDENFFPTGINLQSSKNFRSNQKQQLSDFSRKLKAVTKKLAPLFPDYAKLTIPKLNSLSNEGNEGNPNTDMVDQSVGGNHDSDQENTLPNEQQNKQGVSESNDHNTANRIQDDGDSMEAKPMSTNQNGLYNDLKAFHSTSRLRKDRKKSGVEAEIDKFVDETLKKIPLFSDVKDSSTSRKHKKTDKKHSKTKDKTLGAQIDKLVDDALNESPLSNEGKTSKKPQASNTIALGEDRRSQAQNPQEPKGIGLREDSSLAAEEPQESNQSLPGGGARFGTIVGDIFYQNPSRFKPGVVYHSKKEKVNEKKSGSSTAYSSSKVKYTKKKKRPKS